MIYHNRHFSLLYSLSFNDQAFRLCACHFLMISNLIKHLWQITTINHGPMWTELRSILAISEINLRCRHKSLGLFQIGGTNCLTWLSKQRKKSHANVWIRFVSLKIMSENEHWYSFGVILYQNVILLRRPLQGILSALPSPSERA